VATIAKLGIKLEADGEAFASSVDVAAKKAKGLEDQAKKTAEAAKKMAEDMAKASKKAQDEIAKAAEKAKADEEKQNSVGGRIEALNKTFGNDSALGKITGALAGGAFVGGLTMLASGMEKAAAAAKALSRQYAEGKISANDYATTVGMSIPIFGSVAQSLLDVNEALSAMVGWETDQMHVDKMTAKVEKMDKAFAAMREGAERTKELQDSLAESRMSTEEKEVYAANKRAADAEKAAREAFQIDSKVDATASGRLREQLDLIKQRLAEDLAKLEEAPLLEKAKQNAQTIAGVMDSAAKAAEQAGMSEIEKVLDELKRVGATSGQLAFVEKNLRMKEATEEARKAIEEAKKLADETQKATESKAAAAAEKVKSIIADLRKDMERFSMSDAAKAAAEVRESGGSAAEQNTAAKLRAELDLLTKKRDIIASLETPQEKYNKQLETLNDLLNQGMLTQDEYAKAALNNLEEFKRSQKSMEQGSVGIAMADSAEGIRAIRDRGAQGLGTPQNKELVDLQKKQLAEQQKQNAMSERILKGEGIIQFTVATL